MTGTWPFLALGRLVTGAAIILDHCWSKEGPISIISSTTRTGRSGGAAYRSYWRLMTDPHLIWA